MKAKVLTEKEESERWKKLVADRKVYMEKKRVWTKLMLAKAGKASITVSDAEVDLEMKRLAKSGK